MLKSKSEYFSCETTNLWQSFWHNSFWYDSKQNFIKYLISCKYVLSQTEPNILESRDMEAGSYKCKQLSAACVHNFEHKLKKAFQEISIKF